MICVVQFEQTLGHHIDSVDWTIKSLRNSKEEQLKQFLLKRGMFCSVPGTSENLS